MRGALILLLFAVGGPVLTWQGCQHRQFRSQLASEGVTVTAEAHGGQMRQRRRSSSAELEISYQAEGRVIHQKMPVSTSFMKSISNDDSLTVDTVQVIYLKADPENAVIVGGTPDTSWNLWIGLVVAAIGWGGGGLFLVNSMSGESGGESASPKKKSTKTKRPRADDDE